MTADIPLSEACAFFGMRYSFRFFFVYTCAGEGYLNLNPRFLPMYGVKMALEYLI